MKTVRKGQNRGREIVPLSTSPKCRRVLWPLSGADLARGERLFFEYQNKDKTNKRKSE